MSHIWDCRTCESEGIPGGHVTSDNDFSAAFRGHYPAVLAFARRRIGDTEAEDVAAEVFTIAWRRWDDAPEDVRPWLFGIAKNVLSGQYRSGRRRDRLGEKARLQPPAEVPDHSDDVAASLDLRAAWSELSEEDREVIALVAWDGLSGAQAAQVLAISRMAYTARLSRARKRLRQHVASRELPAGRADDPSGGEPDRAWAAALTEPNTLTAGGDAR